MNEKQIKGERRYAKKYAVEHAAEIAMNQMLYLYNLPLRYRLIAALSIILRWGAVKVTPASEFKKIEKEGASE